MSAAPIQVVAALALPPPVSGQSLAGAILLEELGRAGTSPLVIDIGRDFAPGGRRSRRLLRALHVARLPAQLLRHARRTRSSSPVFYLQLGQGVKALLRDLPLLTIAAAQRWPIVVHVHGAGFRSALEACPTPIRTCMGTLVGRAAAAVVLSESLRTMFDGVVSPERVVVVPNGVTRELATHARSQHESRHEAPVALFLTNIMESKGYVTVLEAARLSEQRGLPWRFVIAGALTEETTVLPDEFIREHRLRNTTYAGVVSGDAKLALLRSSSVLVLPTKHPTEGQPIAMLEAMHFGLPIITCRTGAVPDVVREGVNGLYVPFDAPDALLAAMERLRGDAGLYTQISAANRAEASARYTAEAHGRAMLRVLERAARGEPQC